MMRGVIIGVLILGALGIVVAVVVQHHHQQERAAITEVVMQRTDARARCSVMIGLGAFRHPVILPLRYIEALEHINPIACPDAFRNAWMNYVAAWERRRDDIPMRQQRLLTMATKERTEMHGQVGAGGGVAVGLEGESANGHMEAGGGIDIERERPNLEKAADELTRLDNNELWITCKRVALDYGVFAEGQ
jgi:hypothetical protein